MRKPGALPRSLRSAGVICLLAGLLGASGCVRAPAPEEPPLILFPPPPESPRVQYLRSISSPADLPKARAGFAEFVLGPEPVRYPIVKPINALLVESRLYICDTTVNSVFVYDLAAGVARPLAGDRAMGKIQQPNGIARGPDGRLFVADKLRQAVLVYGPDEKFLDAWGRPGEAQPVAVAVNGDAMYVCDIQDHQIEIWNSQTGAYVRSIGERGSAHGQFLYPTDLALDFQGNLYVTDTGNFRVQKFDPAGDFLMQIGSLGTGLGQFSWPKGLDVDSEGRIYVADSRFANIQIFDDQGRLLLFFGGPGRDRGNLDLPAGLQVQPWPNIPWLSERVAPGFVPEQLVIAVSQKGNGFINFFAVGRKSAGAP